MDTTRHCFLCGKPIAPDAPQGLCPACLLQGALPTGTDTGGQPARFRPPTIEELAPQFPQLDLLGFIGQGGMGAVYKARQKDLDRIVALKILPPDIGTDAAFAERFMREARALARLNHPGIVTIHDFGRTNGLYFFLMEYVDGVSLRQLLTQGRISAREALAIVPQICDALQFAHDQGIIHRDIKPENILLDRRGRLKVADFGLAKIVANVGPPVTAQSGHSPRKDAVTPPTESPQTLTDASKIMGTPQYMSPEQTEHPGEVDHRADIYALGVVFYQMLTGELPGKKFEPPSHKVEIDVRLDEVVLRALEKKPERRYQQVSEVKREVETISSTADKNVSPTASLETAEPPNARRWGAWLTLAMLAAILAGLFWRSFIPGNVLYSNDRPLGLLQADWMRLPSGLAGTWADLNSLGFNGGSFTASFTTLLLGCLGPLGSSKFLAPLTLYLLGICAWFMFRRLGLPRPAALLAALAVALSSTFLSMACWGITQNVMGMAMSYLALGLAAWARRPAPRFEQWTLRALAGLALGVGILEGADLGTLCALIVLAYMVWTALMESVSLSRGLARGLKQMLLAGVFAVLMAPQPFVMLFQPTPPQSDRPADASATVQHWRFATQWSLPKAETAALIVPGLFGYRMDSPKGGAYWGGIGRDPALDPWFDQGRTGTQSPGFLRFVGGGNYLGLLVVLLAVWTALRSFRKQDTVFSLSERKQLWFWTALALICLLLAWGRFAPFYRMFYALPFASSMRNPIRFLEPMALAVSILFGYGLKGLWRQYLATTESNPPTRLRQSRTWWANGNSFDRYWTVGCAVTLGLVLAGFLAYASSAPALAHYLGTVGFDQHTAADIADFSIHQAGWFLLFFTLGTGLLALILSGALAGKRSNWAGLLLGLLLVLDLGRANLPWMVYWNYPRKYATNDVLQFLQQKPYEHRVSLQPFAASPEDRLLNEVYRIEWMQHQFPYYNIQSLDIVSLPRLPADLAAFEKTFQGPNADASGLARRWQLTNTRYLLGPAKLLDTFNRQFDPGQRRFHIAQRFDLKPAPGVSQPGKLEDLTATFSPTGSYAIFEFTGALPRAVIYSNWQVNTNDDLTLKQLRDPAFAPERTVLVNTPLTASPATNSTDHADESSVEFISYSPKEIKLRTQTESASVLLLNDRFDPRWGVTVDGQPATLLRCNYLMRGVQVPAGSHDVRFRFQMPPSLPFASLDVEPDTQAVSFVFHIPTSVPSYVTLSAYGLGIILLASLTLRRRKRAMLNVER